LFIDLDGFKEVNDSLGHEKGDGVLRDVALRIASSVSDGVIVGRLGGDEFLAIMQHADFTRATRVAHDIITGIQDIGATLTRYPMSASVGIATGTGYESPQQLLCRADQAMYRAKAAGPGRTEYTVVTTAPVQTH
jgi:diguanylate cyclase (GGDEF)-like protein